MLHIFNNTQHTDLLILTSLGDTEKQGLKEKVLPAAERVAPKPVGGHVAFFSGREQKLLLGGLRAGECFDSGLFIPKTESTALGGGVGPRGGHSHTPSRTLAWQRGSRHRLGALPPPAVPGKPVQPRNGQKVTIGTIPSPASLGDQGRKSWQSDLFFKRKTGSKD